MAEKKKVEKQVKVEPTTRRVKTNKLELLITIVAREKYQSFLDILKPFDVNMQFYAKAYGTAKDEMLSLFGEDNTKKEVIFSVIRQDKIPEALAALEKSFNTIKKGKGVAFTVPMASIIGVALYGMLSNNFSAIKENGNEKV